MNELENDLLEYVRESKDFWKKRAKFFSWLKKDIKDLKDIKDPNRISIHKRTYEIMQRYKKVKNKKLYPHGCLKQIAEGTWINRWYLWVVLRWQQPWSLRMRDKIDLIEELFTELWM